MDNVQVQDAAIEVEKMLPQSQVNELVGREKAAAAEKARRTAEEQYQAEIAQLKGQMSQSMGGMQQGPQGPNADQVYDQVYSRIMAAAQKQEEEAQQAEQRAQMEKIAGDYYSKVNSVKEKYPDFDAVMGDFKPSAFPEIVMLASGMENAGDVMYALASRPEKVASILQLAQRDPDLARKALGSLAGSISQNEQALSNHREAPAPLSRQKPSVGGVDNGQLNSVSDFKNADWLRG